MENELPKRKKLRLQNFDYNTPRAYFITICTHNKKCTLSNIVGAIHESPKMGNTIFHTSEIVGAIHESPEIKLTSRGIIIDNIINTVPERFNAIIDGYVIMPNHIHIVIILTDIEKTRAIHESPLQSRSDISKIIGYIKMNASKEIHNKYPNEIVWQRGFYDHIIRNQHDYENIVKYIYENPMRWYYDELYAE